MALMAVGICAMVLGKVSCIMSGTTFHRMPALETKAFASCTQGDKESDMKMRQRTMILIATVGLAAFLVCACGGAETRPATIVPPAPDWFDNQPEGCGVGERDYRGNLSLSRNAAVERARADLSRQIETYVAAMIKDTAEEGAEDDLGFSEDLLSETMRSVSAMTIEGSRVVQTQAVGQSYFALVCLDPETFADAFDRMEHLSEQRRAALRKRAAKRFDELDDQIDRIRGRD